ncbi:MAG: BatA domain-containing protein, partial [Cyclobacteriaceae bacterium]
MEFLYPQFLYGLAALAIPIIVHLFNFRKAKRVYFSNNFFLKNL